VPGLPDLTIDIPERQHWSRAPLQRINVITAKARLDVIFITHMLSVSMLFTPQAVNAITQRRVNRGIAAFRVIIVT
jgi:hypothetical protein